MDLDDFLQGVPSSLRHRGACMTCRLPARQRKAIEEAVLAYLVKRRKGETLIAFRSLVLRYLKPELRFPGQPESLKRHMETCLGKTIP